MEENREAGVWQRVLGSREDGPHGDLQQLQREAMELAGAYRALAARTTGSAQELLRKLHQGEQANAAALTGILVLSRQHGEHLKLWQPGQEDSRKLLERCYHRTRRCAVEYMARSADSEFGCVFEQLAKREQTHCYLIAQVLGLLR